MARGLGSGLKPLLMKKGLGMLVKNTLGQGNRFFSTLRSRRMNPSLFSFFEERIITDTDSHAYTSLRALTISGTTLPSPASFSQH